MAGLAGGDEVSLSHDKLREYICSANDAVHIKLVSQESDLSNDATTFKPEMSHQVFGESERIFGYKDLKIELYYSACKLITYLHMTYSEKVDAKQLGVEADNVLKAIAHHLPPGFCQTQEDFVMKLQKDAGFKPYGQMLSSYKLERCGKQKTFEMYKCDISCPGFKEYHARLQTFILWYIDAASFIDIDDDRWRFYLLFERYQQDGRPRHAVVGYITVYNYYAYPQRLRPCVSQMLVLPPHQQQGHGTRLLRAVYADLASRADVLDITVEDPSEDFQRVRDYTDSKICAKLDCFAPEKLQGGWCEEMAKTVREKTRINRKQARRVYEILRLRTTNVHDAADYRAYRLDVKNRLNKPFSRDKMYAERMQKAFSTEEVAQAVGNLSNADRLEKLQKMYEELEKEYRHTIDRLDRARL
ncbi:PREDICTED: histone acetyltransferase type B catalytic subunit-like [Priapulus caudatus]|uniref:Histone acetyltransferase type B catalytic subunit n=1 Tax=Priapulus caudatus TaxID=37621 RepID=A0ABM1DT69_PRICU|nr:PREDICTED: histone acetyltransferase type B catalytic subunit-like [Priapulus caudatus]